MNKKRVGIFALILLLIVVSVAVITNDSEEESQGVVNEREEVVDNYDELRDIITGFIGTPYELGPLDEGENIYREDVFDCTTFILVTVANLHSQNPEEKIKDINYHPPGEVSYETRLHFSTYRNEVNDYFTDITADVAGDYLNQREISLNKDRIIDIDWEEDITIDEVRVENASEVVHNLPEVAGVMFMRDENEEIGLDINHEGFVLDGEDLVHASPTHDQVYREDLLDYIQNSDYDSVGFYKIN